MNTYLNRELSWLKFNERVLEEAESREVPLCERLTFASIYQSNLDEFFMVRVGSLMDQMSRPPQSSQPPGRMPRKRRQRFWQCRLLPPSQSSSHTLGAGCIMPWTN